MKKRTVWVAALMSLTLSGMAQQVLPKDVAGDKEYARVCKEYELRSENSISLLEAYLDKYPDSRHANRVESMIASVYFDEEKYPEAIAVFRSCELDALPDKERDDAALKLATSYLKIGNLEEAAVWFTLLKEVSKTH
jgi:tetratricopeptide (TPR) repeat protein